MTDAAGRAALGIEHHKRIALGALGGFAQDSAGEIFSPTQFGLALLLPALLVGIRSPSLKADEDSVNTPSASRHRDPRSPSARRRQEN